MKAVKIIIIVFLFLSCSQQDAKNSSISPSGVSTTGSGGNRPPVVTSASIIPSHPTSNTELSVNYQGSDPDGDNINYTFRWFVDNELAQESPVGSLPAGAFKKGSEVYVEVIPSDKYSKGEVFRTASIVIGNMPPVVKSVTLTPSQPRVGDVITVEATAEDPDGDDVNFRYQWYVNTDPSGEPTESRQFNTSRLKKKDRVAVVVYPSDRDTAGEPFVSDPVTLLNRPPVITSLPNYDIADGIYSYQVVATDPDGDRLTYALKKGPAGMTIESSTGLVRWKVPDHVDEQQEVFIQVSVDDGDGGQHSQEFSIILKPK